MILSAESTVLPPPPLLTSFSHYPLLWGHVKYSKIPLSPGNNSRGSYQPQRHILSISEGSLNPSENLTEAIESSPKNHKYELCGKRQGAWPPKPIHGQGKMPCYTNRKPSLDVPTPNVQAKEGNEWMNEWMHFSPTDNLDMTKSIENPKVKIHQQFLFFIGFFCQNQLDNNPGPIFFFK